jgi:hypothetical protein
MFNPDGADSDYEWIECYNPNDYEILIDDYRFRENDTNHHMDDFIVPAKSFVIIAQNKTKFLDRYPGLDGITIDSSFSLSNSGEMLSILSGANYPADVVDELTYSTMNEGGIPSGQSLHLAVRKPPADASANDKQIDWVFSTREDKVSQSYGNDIANPGTALWITNPDNRKSGFVFQIK